VKTKIKRVLQTLAVALLVPFLLPDAPAIPVQGATPKNWNPRSFWFSPWGASGVHKGIDIFAPTGRPVVSSSAGVVIYTGTLGIGGNVVAVLGPRWRVHYFAHLHDIAVTPLTFVANGSPIGTVGTTGNAFGKAPHLHFSIVSLVPLPWKTTTQPEGWKRMFYLDPAELLQ
jgi:peptidoglycan LD-endopeptidase LytH